MIKIDLFYFLLIIELALILLVLSAYFFSRNRKHKDLYQKTLRKLRDLQSREDGGTSDSSPAAAAPRENPPEELPVDLTNDPVDLTKDNVDQQPLTDSVFTESPDGDETSPDKVQRLQNMVNFQKKAIVELMCYKDIFESARSRLDALRQSNTELEEKIKGLIESGAEVAGLAEAATALEKNNHELEKFIAILDRENTTLSGKFQVWEDKFKRIAEDAKESSDTQVPDDGKYSEVMQEKEELLSKVKEFEEKLDEKGKSLEAMQLQYEDLEKEYMILYRQQQALEQQKALEQQPEVP